MSRVVEHFMSYLEALAPPAAKTLPEDVKYQRYMIPAFLSFCFIDSLLFGIYSAFFLKSEALTAFAFGLVTAFIFLLVLSRMVMAKGPLVLSYSVLIGLYALGSLFSLEQAYLLLLISRYASFATVGLLFSGPRVGKLPAFLIVTFAFLFFAVIFLSSSFGPFVLPAGVKDREFMQAFLVSNLLSGFLIYALMSVYSKSCDFSFAYMEKQKQWHDSHRLTKEFVNLAGDMNSVMHGPLEDVLNALNRIQDPRSAGGADLNLAIIKRASEAIYGIARSFGVLAQNQRESCNVRIDLDELVRYAQIICENHFKGLGVKLCYESGEEALEFVGPSGRWLLLLVSLLQFMADQVSRSGGRTLHLKRQRLHQCWELVLTAEGVAPFEFPFELHQKLKEESTQELLEQTSGKAFIYLLDRWGLKLGSFQPVS